MNKRLEEVIEDYKIKLEAVEESKTSLSMAKVLAVLTARDVIQALLTDKNQLSDRISVKLVNLDHKLESLSTIINEVIDLPKIKKSFHPQPDAWWWLLKPSKKKIFNWWDKYDKIWNYLSIFFLGISIVIYLDISSRFIGGERDIVASSIIFIQTFLATTVTTIIFTEDGRRIIGEIFSEMKIPIHFQQEIRLIASLILLILIISFKLYLPKLANDYTNRGIDYYNKNLLVSLCILRMSALGGYPPRTRQH